MKKTIYTKHNMNHTTPKLQRSHNNILSSFKIILPLLAIILLGTSTSSTSALTYQDNVELQFTWDPTIRISLSSADLIIDNLTPGTSSDSNIITVNVGTNNVSGYTLSATAGNTTNASTNLVNTVDNTKLFTSLATDASLASLTTDNTWGYSYSTNNGTNWSNYSGLPLYTAASGAELINNDGSGSTPVQFKIAAKASTIQASGAYTNTINFTAVANPEPTPQPITCDAGKICYSENALDSEGTMAEQEATSNAETTLMASNYSRSGYGFAGWSPTMDGSGKIYGPQETITTGDLSSTGMPLYAIWVHSAGSMQDSSKVASVCNSLTKAPIDGTANLSSVSALTDQRDNNTYAIAKLADGKCWMIENMRLDNTNSDNSAGALAQGYATNATYGNFVGLANPETPWASNITTANSLYSTDGADNTTNIGTTDAAQRFPRYNNQNTASRASSPDTNANTYSYGNYYTWAAAITDLNNYTSNNASVTSTSICPTGWHLPNGGQTTVNTTADFYVLSKSIMKDSSDNSIEPDQYASSGCGYYGNSVTNATGKTATAAIRSYPNNFLYSGSVYSGSVRDRGSNGNYWSSTAYSSNGAYYLGLYSSEVNPGTNYGNKYVGRAIRCLLGS